MWIIRLYFFDALLKILDLKVVMMKDKQMMGVSSAKHLPKKAVKKNKGVEERIQKDLHEDAYDAD
jgi:hypothetical protein